MKLNKKAFENIALISQIGVSMITPIILCILIGNYLDRKLNTNLIFLIIFTIIGVGSSFVTLLRLTEGNYKRKRK